MLINQTEFFAGTQIGKSGTIAWGSQGWWPGCYSRMPVLVLPGLNKVGRAWPTFAIAVFNKAPL